MTAPITRKRALELAIKCVTKEMAAIYQAVLSERDAKAYYAELAAALAWLETQARQKELL